MTLNPWRLRLLDVFERVGTVRGVAAELRLSPSTVSQQFVVLEAETGAQLFERTGRSLRLTATGGMLVERARDLRDHADSIEAEIQDATTGAAGHLRVGGFSSSFEPILGELVPRQCRLDGFEPIVAGRFSSYPVLLAHVAAGLSVAVLPELAATLRPGLVRRPTVGLADRSIVAAARRANVGRPAVIAVIETLRQVADRLATDRAG